MTMSVPEEKLQEIKHTLQTWANKALASKREIQSILGKLQFAAKCVKPGRVFIARMLEHLRSLTFVPPDKKTPLPTSFLKDIAWWQKFMERYNGVSITSQESWSTPDTVFATDACLEACGGHTTDAFFHCVFLPNIRGMDLHINALEMLTVAIALKLWGHRFRGKKIRILCDNLSSVQVINTGRSKDPFLSACSREIAFLAACNEFELRCLHLSSEENRLTDLLSRWEKDPKNQEKFFKISGLNPPDEQQVPAVGKNMISFCFQTGRCNSWFKMSGSLKEMPTPEVHSKTFRFNGIHISCFVVTLT